LSAPRKHYKIIFIKAPSAPSLTQQIAAAQAQSQEKTLIYVLVKKPEDISFGPGPQPVPELPVSKPEVYFIKYKTQKEAGGAGHSSGQAHSGGHSSGSGISAGGIDIPQNPQSSYGPPPSPPSSNYGTPFKK
jgi:hypothetical protein